MYMQVHVYIHYIYLSKHTYIVYILSTNRRLYILCV